MRQSGWIALVLVVGAVRGEEPVGPILTPVVAEPIPAHPTPTSSPTVTIVESDDDDEAPSKVRGPLGPNWGPDEYLLWWLAPQQVPSMLIRGPMNATPSLSDPRFTQLIGGRLEPQAHSGGRFVSGWAIDQDQTLGMEVSYFFLGSRSRTLAATSAGGPGDPALYRPFQVPGTGETIAELIAGPGFAAGGFELVASSRMQGVEVNGLANLYAGACVKLDSILGFRFLQVNEGLRIASRTSYADAGRFAITDIVDQIDGHNEFYGGQLGLRLDVRRGKVFLDMTGKVALGQTNEVVKINGLTVITGPAGVDSVSHVGFYSGPNNSGRFTHSTFAVVPEATVRFGVMKQHSRWFIGYNFLALSQLARPGDQIDTQLGHRVATIGDPGQFLDRPRHQFQQSSFWAQGLMIGAEVRY